MPAVELGYAASKVGARKGSLRVNGTVEESGRFVGAVLRKARKEVKVKNEHVVRAVLRKVPVKMAERIVEAIALQLAYYLSEQDSGRNVRAVLREIPDVMWKDVAERIVEAIALHLA